MNVTENNARMAGDENVRHETVRASGRNLAQLIGILLIALTVRVGLFSGFQGRDDRNYAAYAISVARNHHFPVEIQTQWVGRIGHWLPIAGVLKLGGVSEWNLGLYSLACSLMGVAITYEIGRLLFDSRVAALAAIFLSIFPVDVIYSTTAYADVPVATFMLLALLAMLKGTCTRSSAWLLLAGLSTGMAYLCRPTAVAMLPGLALIGWCSGMRRMALWAPAGLLMVLAAEAAFWHSTTGDPLHGIHAAQAKQAQNERGEAARAPRKAEPSPSGVLSWVPGPRAHERYRSNNSFLDLLLMFVTNQEFGLFYLMAGPALLMLAIRQDGPVRWLLLWIATVTLILGFFPFMSWSTLPRDPRYYACLSGPVCVGIAAWLWRLRPTMRRGVSLLLIASSLVCLGLDSSRLAMDGVRQLAEVIRQHPEQSFWIPPQDRFALCILQGGECEERLGVHTLTAHPDSDSYISMRLVCPQLRTAGALADLGDGRLVLPPRTSKALSDESLTQAGWRLDITLSTPRSPLREQGFQWGEAIGVEDKYLQRLFPGQSRVYSIWSNDSHVRL